MDFTRIHCTVKWHRFPIIFTRLKIGLGHWPIPCRPGTVQGGLLHTRRPCPVLIGPWISSIGDIENTLPRKHGSSTSGNTRFGARRVNTP